MRRNCNKIKSRTSVKNRPLEEVLRLLKYQPRQLKTHYGKIKLPTQHDISAQTAESFRTVLHDVKQAHSRLKTFQMPLHLPVSKTKQLFLSLILNFKPEVGSLLA